ncbi:MAG: hypothetical protein ABW128_06945 [Rhizorhabdus sp.]
MAFAEGTTVAFEKSIAEIVGTLRKSGAQRIGQEEGPDQYLIQFLLQDRLIRFRLPLPKLESMPTMNGRRETLTAPQRRDKLDQAVRQRGRALLLVIKAKLESVESKIETLEEAFLANVVMADGMTVYERVAQPIQMEYESGKPQVMMLPPPPAN